MTRRNFYLTLFRLYSAIPFNDCITSFTKIYNDVFINELPGAQSTYALCELLICELSGLGSGCESLRTPFRYSFSNNTSRYANYARMPTFMRSL